MSQENVKRLRRCQAFAFLAASLVAACGAPASDERCEGSHWVGAWESAPRLAGESFADETLRLIVTPHLGGRTARVGLTNRYGASDVVVTQVTIGVRASGPELLSGSTRTVAFGGERSVVIPPRRDVTSDPVQVRFEASSDLAISIHIAHATGPTTAHPLSFETSYVAHGDHTGDGSGGAFTSTITTWPFLAGVDVLVPTRTGAVVAFGDSLTDGFPSGEGRNRRYPDFLARRLAQARTGLSALNEGLGGDRLLDDAPPKITPDAVERVTHDVPVDAGVRDVIVLEGTNDLGDARPSVADLVGALKRITAQLHQRGLNVLLGTIPPFGREDGPGYGGPKADASRVAINSQIRRGGLADGVVDFDAAVRDPNHPERLLPAYDAGEHLHLNAAGYRRMAAAVPLSKLTVTRCP